MEKIALCAIGRRENQYAPEWVEHYRKMGFDHIYIYDNNHEGEEHFEDVLKTYVASGYVTIVDWRDRAEAETQIEAYNHCIQRYRNRYTWMAFFDFDEFLTITDGSDIHTFVESRNRYDCILINWMDMTDNDLVRNDHRPLAERFTQPMDYDRSGIGGDFPENDHVKSIVRCGVYGLEFRKNPHVPTVPAMPCCNAEGKEVKQKARLPYIHKTAYLKHYTTKTIEEWLENKMAKGAAGLEYETFIKTYADFFFKVNERTPEKEAFIKEWYGNGHVSALALGRLGNQMFIACAAMKLAKDTGRQFAGLAYNDTSKKPREWDYPEGQFKTVMKRVKYVEPDTLKGYHRMERGQYLSNGLPVHLPHLDILLNDYFQDARCIDRDDALKLFAPTKAVFATIRRHQRLRVRQRQARRLHRARAFRLPRPYRRADKHHPRHPLRRLQARAVRLRRHSVVPGQLQGRALRLRRQAQGRQDVAAGHRPLPPDLVPRQRHQQLDVLVVGSVPQLQDGEGGVPVAVVRFGQP